MPFSQDHALLIGVGTYQHEPKLSVPVTAADAEAVAAVLRDPTYCGYPIDQVSVLRDHTANRNRNRNGNRNRSLIVEESCMRPIGCALSNLFPDYP